MRYIVLRLNRGTTVDEFTITRKDADDAKGILVELFGKDADPLHYSVDRFGDGTEFLFNALLGYRLYTTEKDYNRDLTEAVVRTVMKMLKRIDFVHYARNEKNGPEYFFVPDVACQHA